MSISLALVVTFSGVSDSILVFNSSFYNVHVAKFIKLITNLLETNATKLDV